MCDAGLAAILSGLENNDTLTELMIGSRHVDGSRAEGGAAAALARLLRKNKSIKRLRLCHVSVDNPGEYLACLSDGLMENTTLESLDLSDNVYWFGDSGAEAFAEAFLKN